MSGTVLGTWEIPAPCPHGADVLSVEADSKESSCQSHRMLGDDMAMEQKKK